jgi:DNA (cytosine-5)-methyltransferase 1
MKVLSLFSGVGGFDLGLERAGMETVFQCEWDKHATKILEKHWPNVPRWTDVSTLTGEHILSHAPVIDVVAWGSPCQDLSVAGKRAGLEGARSGLFHEGVRIIKELKELTNGKYPRISIWENVAGALSSGKGADFGQVLTEMDEAGACFSEWRILDAQYFGVPQRRRRVFLISVFDPATAARCPDPLLPVSESVRRDTETGNTARQEPASETATSTRSRGAIIGSDIVGPLAASDWKFPQQQQVHENKCVVETFTKGKRPQTSTDDETWDENRPAPTLNAFDQGDTRATTIIAFASNQRAEVRDLEDRAVALSAEPGTNQQTYIAFENSYRDAARIATDGITNTLSAKMGTGGNNTPMVAFPIQDGREIEKNQNGIGVADDGTPAYTLDQTGAQAVAYGLQGNMIGRQDHNGPQGAGISHPDDPMFSLTSTDIHAVATLVTMREGKEGGGKGPLISQDKSLSLSTGNEQTLFQPQAIAFQPGTMIRMSGGVWDELAPTLRAEAKRGDNEPHIATNMAVRRLTPLECERLMGWPDDWTAGQSDTHRYKQCGNGVASPVATWIAQQLLQLDKEPANATQTENPTT